MQRIVGTETEFGIVSRDSQYGDPVSNSVQLIAAYPSLLAPNGIWDYENENPLLDARGFEVEGERERPGPDYNRLLNKLLGNGGRWYVDGAHPEYATAECSNPREVVAQERAGLLVAAESLKGLNQRYGKETFLLYKNNSDGKGNSYGYHENYLVARAIPFDTLTKILVPFLVTRQIMCGAGKVGSENASTPTPFQISQRADFCECLVDLNTMVKRPIMNSRDEPHTEHALYRRLHVIVGDANMAEVSTYLKVGTLALVLQMAEAGAELPMLELDNPVGAIKAISRDLEVKEDLRLAGGTSTKAIAIQREYLKAAHEFFACHECSPQTKDVLVKWESVLDKLEQDPSQLAGELDWVAKQQMMMSYMDRKGCGWKDPWIAMLDLQYHDIRPEKGLYYTLEKNNRMERVVLDEEIVKAVHEPPQETRAYFRGTCVNRFPKNIYGMSWTSVLFDVGETKIKRIPLMDPTRGTKALTGELFASVQSVEELLEKLGA